MMRRAVIVSAWLAGLWILAACTSTFEVNNDGGDGGFFTDGLSGQCVPGQDWDGDKIPDDVETCWRDADGDNIPDFMDLDSDGDQIPDSIEAGRKDANGNCATAKPEHNSWPCDHDGDGIPDYRDPDSDNDGIPDGDEDLNGDGLLGCCLNTCGEKRAGCPDVKADECGKGQTCSNGVCQPLAHFLCANGETDPKKAQTFPDGPADKDLPNFVCRPGSETDSTGLKKLSFRKSLAGDWHLALETASTYGELALPSPKAKEAAAAFDLTAPNQGVAGFIVSLPATGTDVSTIASQLVTKINTQLPDKASVTQIVSGSATTSHDKYPTVVNTQLEIELTTAKNVPNVRNQLLAVLLSRQVGQLGPLPPANFGPVTKSHVLEFQTLLRPADGRLLVMGAIADKAAAYDKNKPAGFHIDDLANGTCLATAGDTDTIECDPFTLGKMPIADIIWIVDESGSMNDNRQDIVNNANDFFNRAQQSGLNFRMGVAGVKNPNAAGVIVGKFCSRISTDQYDDGGEDRFLLPSEKDIFEACIKNPPYYEGGSEYGLAQAYEAVTLHLPRQPNNPKKIRADASLVVIIVTDEAPQELKTSGTYKGKTGFLSYTDYSIQTCSTTKMAQINDYIQDWLTLYSGKHPQHKMEAKATVHLIAGVCKATCNPEYPWGYEQVVQATGGQIADICQKNLGTTLQNIIDSITGQASPVILEYVPMSASLAVAINTKQLQRSRTSGFDYNRPSNSILFLGVPFQKGDLVAVSYRRWVKQTIKID